MCFSSKNGLKYFKYIGEVDTTIVNSQLSIVNYLSGSSPLNRNLRMKYDFKTAYLEMSLASKVLSRAALTASRIVSA